MQPHAGEVSVMALVSSLVGGLAEQLRLSEHRNLLTPKNTSVPGTIRSTAAWQAMTHATVESMRADYENAVCYETMCLTTA
jgi:hypothetical protein